MREMERERGSSASWRGKQLVRTRLFLWRRKLLEMLWKFWRPSA